MPRDLSDAADGSTAPKTRSRRSRALTPLILVVLILAGIGAIVWRGAEANRAAAAAIDELTELSNNQNLIDAIISQNARTRNLTTAEIATLDAQYKQDAQTGGGIPAEMMQRPQSQYLKRYTEDATNRIVFIMLMDARGLNVAASRPTTDYFQGDEDKWLKTYPLGAGAIDWSPLERDYVTNRLQYVVSRTVINPRTGDSIGTLSIAFDKTALRR
ncbi:MAG: hypothetical protein ABWZ40_11920 [Caulobacterales bacterium]